MKASSIGTRQLALIGLGVLLIAAMTYVVMRSGPLAPTRVTVMQAAEGRLTPQLFGIGTVEARRSYLIGPTTAGRVRSVAVDVGDTVKAGQALAEMDPVDLDERTAALDASVARAGSAMAAAEAQRRDAQARKELAAVISSAARIAAAGRPRPALMPPVIGAAPAACPCGAASAPRPRRPPPPAGCRAAPPPPGPTRSARSGRNRSR